MCSWWPEILRAFARTLSVVSFHCLLIQDSTPTLNSSPTFLQKETFYSHQFFSDRKFLKSAQFGTQQSVNNILDNLFEKSCYNTWFYCFKHYKIYFVWIHFHWLQDTPTYKGSVVRLFKAAPFAITDGLDMKIKGASMVVLWRIADSLSE